MVRLYKEEGRDKINEKLLNMPDNVSFAASKGRGAGTTSNVFAQATYSTQIKHGSLVTQKLETLKNINALLKQHH